MKLKKTYLAYYLTLSVISTVLVGYTILVGSTSVNFGTRTAQLKTEQLQLIAQKHSLEEQLTQEITTAALDEFSQEADFIAITQPVHLQVDTFVAQK